MTVRRDGFVPSRRGLAEAHGWSLVLLDPGPAVRHPFRRRRRQLVGHSASSPLGRCRKWISAEGIPPEHRTLVVVPTMLSRAEGVAELLEALEVRFLANRDVQLHFGLLTDFEDAPQETMPADDELVRLAKDGVEQLNTKYAKHRPDAFFLFHRPRRWNAQEGIWMGYERKRGKLAEFNALLRGGARDRFSQVVGDTSVLPDVRYVITLDTDTQLPRDSAREMVGTMAHPLNRPVLDRQRRRVVDGLRHFAAARRRELAQRAAIVVRAAVCGRRRHRPLHAGRIGRLPGSVRRRFVRGQGYLRRRRL